MVNFNPYEIRENVFIAFHGRFYIHYNLNDPKP